MALPTPSSPDVPDATPPPRNTLYLQVLVAIALGIALGWLKPEWGLLFKPLGDGFVKLIKMLISPIVFCTVAAGIAGMGDLKKVGRVGAKALLYFEVMTTVALVLGLLVVTLAAPGAGVHASVESLDTTDLKALLDDKEGERPKGVVAHLLAIVPASFIGAFAKNDVLQVLVLAIIAGLALASLRQKAQPVLNGLEQASHLLFAMVGVVMRLAPFGAFGAMAFTIAKHGIGTLGNLAQLMLTFYATALVFVVVVLGTVLRLTTGLGIGKLARYLRGELLIVLGTSSSESALPALMGKLEKLGCQPSVVRLVVPTGYSFNLDGTCIYLTMASSFVAQALDVKMTVGDQVSLLLVLLLTSKGAAGVTGSGFVTLAATLQSVGKVPVAGLSLILGIDRFMSEARALTNMMGNAVATLVVSRWEGALDVAQAKQVLDEGPPQT